MRRRCQSARILDLIEAYVVDGRPTAAAELLDAFAADAERAGRASALAVSARCRGLFERGDEADRWFAAALAHTDSEVSAFERARTQLRFGERLKEMGKQEQAREQCTAALFALSVWARGRGRSRRGSPWSRPATKRQHVERWHRPR